MPGSSKPQSPLHHTVRAERAVKRYRVRLEDGTVLDASERTRLALSAFAAVFRRERGDTLYAGALAHSIGDGNGWTAHTTIRSFLKRGWVEEARHEGGNSWQSFYRLTDEGLKVLRLLDAEWPHERCPACEGETLIRHHTADFMRLREGVCTSCEGTALKRRRTED